MENDHYRLPRVFSLCRLAANVVDEYQALQVRYDSLTICYDRLAESYEEIYGEYEKLKGDNDEQTSI